ncbi:MAG: hypothetical protein ACKV0T_04850 [Planctomycetales bacterium]
MPYASYSPEQVVSRGQEIYERDIRSRVETGNDGKFVVIDIETGDFEVDEEDLMASKRLLARRPNAVIYGLRVGRRAAYRLGSASRV